MRLVDLMIAGVLSGVASDQLIAAPTEQSQFKTNHAAGYCILFSPYQDDVVEGATMRTIGVERVAWNYAAKILRVGVGVEMPLSSDIYVEVYPSHGRLNLERATVHSAEAWAYHPDPGFVGADKAVFLVRIKGHLIRVVASLRVEASMEKILANRCSPYGWVISSADVGESAAIARTALTLNRSDLGSLISSAIYSVQRFVDLPGSTLGATDSDGVSGRVNLDIDAAGHRWFADPTPLNNSDECLPTADEGIWLAKPGSAAEGKMDLLSVLLHETDRRFNRMRPSIAPRKRHQAG